ncbi:hypothetical protein ATM17_08195 [Sphingopyxis macrogoltabida]|uniref:Uncharacterized protein n=2 Tax=Sphingomonadaceae TaxID=41297 RepID=A0AAC8YZU6_SPHMC|nr:hypothetical protein LH19_11685 [Sphingopyxis macrogoltabida]AMU89019.1 hypothetical protein ATM17_08195 [Sphingopyxis macrogoltabida]
MEHVMRLFHLLFHGEDAREPRRVEFRAPDAYQAFQFALNDRGSAEVELWDGEQLLVRMSKTEANLWKLHGLPPSQGTAGPSAQAGAAAA